jgi:hypothetical protein
MSPGTSGGYDDEVMTFAGFVPEPGPKRLVPRPWLLSTPMADDPPENDR